MSDSEDEVPDETIFVADSVDEFVERRRYQELFEARERAAEALNSAVEIEMRARGSGQQARDAKRAAVRQAVAGYVWEAEELFKNTQAGRKLWNNVELATIELADVIDPGNAVNKGESFDGLSNATSRKGLQPERQNGRWVLQLWGVGDYVELSKTRIRAKCNVGMDRRGHAQKTREMEISPSMPVAASREVYRATNALLAQSDLGIRMEAADGNEVESDYSEYLDTLDDE